MRYFVCGFPVHDFDDVFSTFVAILNGDLQEGRAALHLAAEKDHLNVVELLLEHKAFVNAKNKAGVTPAHLAAERGAAEIVELLVEKYSAATDVISLVGQFSKRLVESSVVFLSVSLAIHIFPIARLTSKVK